MPVNSYSSNFSPFYFESIYFDGLNKPLAMLIYLYYTKFNESKLFSTSTLKMAKKKAEKLISAFGASSALVFILWDIGSARLLVIRLDVFRLWVFLVFDISIFCLL